LFSTYDLKAFSSRLREIRKSLGYTQDNVVTGTGLSGETLRKLENGLVVPRYDTIEMLSLFYKTDLQAVLNNYKSSSELIKYYEIIDYHIVGYHTASIISTIDSFNQFLSESTLKLIDIKELHQLKLLFHGLYLSYTTNDAPDVIDTVIDTYIESIRICNPAFSIEHWRQFKYSNVELRILFALASLYGVRRACELSNALLFFINDSMDFSFSSKHIDKLLIAKAFVLISYNYHRMDQHELALEYASKGIAYCNQHAIMSNLALLLARKGTAMYFLKQTGYLECFDQALSLLVVQDNFELAEIYRKAFEKYKESDLGN
jgi:transcriptional regulator with XRE-family HTH domain